MQKPSVYDFQDFAGFFSAYVDYMKQLNKNFSWRWIAKRLQLKSHTPLINYANGKKTPSDAMLAKISNLFNFTIDEYVYAKFLVGLQLAKNDSERSFYLEKLHQTKRSAPLPILSADSFDAMSHWYHLVIFEMFGLPGFDPDPAWIAAKLRHALPLDLIRDALDRLLKVGLLKHDEKGVLRKAVDGFFTTHNVPSNSIVAFHDEMLDLAKHAIKNVAVPERVFLSYTMPFDSRRLEEAQNLMVEFRARFAQLLEGGAADSVYHLSLSYFPTTIR